MASMITGNSLRKTVKEKSKLISDLAITLWELGKDKSSV